MGRPRRFTGKWAFVISLIVSMIGMGAYTPARAQFFKVTPIVQGNNPATFDSVRIGGASDTGVSDINDQGQIVGSATFFYNNGTAKHAFLWDSTSGFTDLGDLGDGLDYSRAQAINNNGTVVGFSCLSDRNYWDFCDEIRAFVSDGGSMTELEAPFVLEKKVAEFMSDDDKEAEWINRDTAHVAVDVNINGQTVGTRVQSGTKVVNSIVENFGYKGASLWNGASHVDMDEPLDEASHREELGAADIDYSALAINDLGDVTVRWTALDPEGTILQEGTSLWNSSSGRVDFDDLFPPGFTPLTEINNSRQVVGRSDALGGYALWDPEQGVRSLNVGFEEDLNPEGLNDLGQVLFEPDFSFQSPALWLPDSALGLPAGLHDLDGRTLGEWDLMEARHLSNTGHIIAVAEGPDGTERAVLLTPTQPNDIDPFAVVTLTASNFPWSGEAGDPVNTRTGEFTRIPPPDLDLGGPLPLRFQRYHGSLLRREGKIQGRLGDNWLHNFEWTLRQAEDTVVVVTWRGATVRFEHDGVRWQLVRTPDTPYQLVETSEGFRLGDPRRERIYTFDAAGRLTRVADRNGNAHVLTYTGAQLMKVADGLGRTLTFSYNEDGLLETVSDGTRTVEYYYESNGPLQGLDEVFGGGVESSYAPTLYRAEDGFQATEFSSVDVKLQYDEQGRVARQEIGDGAYTFAYGPDATTVTGPLGGTEQHTHGANGALALTSGPAGSRSLGSDADGRRSSVTDRVGETTTLSYHAPTGRVTSITYPDGTSMTHTYAAQEQSGLTFYDKIQTTYPDGTTETYSYDEAGNVTSVTDRAGRTGTFTYNERGQVVSATNPAGGTSTFTYNADGTIASATGPMGNTRTFSYDDLRRRARMTYADGSTVERTYNEADRVLTETDERGNTTTYTYTFDGLLESVNDPLGGTRSFEYNDGLLTSILSSTGARTTFSHDRAGHVTSTTDPNGNSTSFSYDPAGRITGVTDPAGNTWTRSYDAEGRLTAASNPLGHTVQYTYDAKGRPRRITSPGGNATELGYDGMGRVTSLTGSERSATYRFNVMGRLTNLSTGGVATAVQRNALGQITNITGPTGEAWTRTYNAAGVLVAATDPLGHTTTYSYNERGWVEQVDRPDATLSITHDPAGNVTEQSYSGGPTLNYTYDANGRLTAATGVTLDRNARGDVVSTNGMAVTRDAGGRITSLTLAEGKTISYSYDARGLLTEVSDWEGGSTTFSYDAAGRLTAVERPNGVVTTYTYDSDNRVVGIEERKGETLIAAHALTRDVSGNVTSATRNVPQGPEAAPNPETFSVGAGHQITGFSYDAAGRRTQDDRRSYTWDAASRLTSYSEDGQTVEYTYDAFGNLLTRTEGSTTREYVQNYALGLPSISVVREGGSDPYYYVHTPDGRLLYRIAADSSRQFYHYDEMGNTIMLTGEAGAVVAAYAYTPYGQIVGQSGAIQDNPFTYRGKYGVIREGSGLYRMRRRLYDAKTRRFTTREPVAGLLHPQLANPYQYAAQNPRRYIDPLGASPSEPSTFEGSTLDQATSLASKAQFPSTFAGVSTTGMDIKQHSFRIRNSKSARGLVGVLHDAADQQLQNAHTSEAFGDAKDYQRFSRNSRRFRDVANGADGVGKWAGRVGQGATVAGVANDLGKTYNRINAATAEITQAQDASLSTLDRHLAEANRLKEQKIITPARHEELVRSIFESYQARQDAESAAEVLGGYNIGIVTETVIGANNAASNLIPDPAGWTRTSYKSR